MTSLAVGMITLLCAVVLFALLHVGAALPPAALDEQVMLEQSRRSGSGSFEVIARAVLDKAESNANLRQALAHPSLSVHLYVGRLAPCGCYCAPAQR